MTLIESKIHSINERISYGFHNMEDIGVLNGLSGLALFNFYYSKNFKTENKTGQQILEKCIDKINEGYSKPTYCNGIIGLGWVINHLIKEKFIDSSNNEVLSDIDTYASYYIQESLLEKNIDALHGAIGYAHYFVDRWEQSTVFKSKELIEDHLLMLVENLKHLFTDIELFAKEKEITVKMSFQNRVAFGLAHGISSIIFILNKISKISKLQKESLILADCYADYLFKYKDTKNTGISIFPNYLDSEGIVKYSSALSWCSGDLGIGINLLNTSINYNQKEKHKDEGIRILKKSAYRMNLEQSLLQTNGFCHGYFGASKIFSDAYRITKDKDLDKTSQFWLKLGLENLTIKDNNDLSILYGLSGIGLTLLETFSSERLKWDECLFLQ
ncbi:lanthionine synthetase LanC family protein [Flavobacterium sp. ASV13]|uniref:lanthionine synthetase LanC family protein n=1 Tax=Flavobacterium sp. ASV13 TaxID=1506583 RepID=UPI000551EA7C|nr:lanthionine synthetase LanC family protein [Flavobacterium sp. ASV13]